jgi:CRISPR-associated protein Csb2
MARHAAGMVYAAVDAARFVHGHDPVDAGKPAKGDGADVRLSFLPLPTVNGKLNRIESIRRVLVAGPADHAERVRQLARRLAGEELIWEGDVRGILVPLPSSDWVVGRYTVPSRDWSTVTPVVLPGYDDRDGRKTEALLRKAFVHSGIPDELVPRGPDLEWRDVAFRAGVDLASRFIRPDKLTGRTVHVRARFPQPVVGPLAVGAGRYRGFGLFAAEM